MSEPYVAKFTDATPLVNKIKASKPDFLFPVSYITDALLIIRTMKQMNVNAGIFGGGAGYLIPDFVKDMGKDAEYVFSVASWNNDINCGEVSKIAETYEKKYGEFLMEHAGEAYVMMWVIADAIGLHGPREGPGRHGQDQSDQGARLGHARLPRGVRRQGVEQARPSSHDSVAGWEASLRVPGIGRPGEADLADPGLGQARIIRVNRGRGGRGAWRLDAPPGPVS